MSGRRSLRDLVPHAGRMVLLDTVESWDESGITCRAFSHTDPSNPLRRDNQLSAVCGIEYAAQAMAAHAALVAGGSVQPGLLASVREVRMRVQRLDEIAGALTIRAAMRRRDSRSVVYTFFVSSGALELLSGRAAVFFV